MRRVGIICLCILIPTAGFAAAAGSGSPISIERTDEGLLLSFSGALQESSDGVHWNDVPGATVSPCLMPLDSVSGRFFRSYIIPAWTAHCSDSVALELLRCESGTFMMGSPESEPGRWDDEVRHEVTLTRAFWIGECEVTQAQYEAVMGENPSEFRGETLPVEQVSWEDAMEFCRRLTESERNAGNLPAGYVYSLPTEAQWEYACRAGTDTGLNNGLNLTGLYECPNLDAVAWYRYNSDGMTHPVGGKLPNAWGLYDMHGNVYEWCLDGYEAYAEEDETDPTGPVSGPDRCFRGGAWLPSAQLCHSGFRMNAAPDFRSNYIGFRVALVPEGYGEAEAYQLVPEAE